MHAAHSRATNQALDVVDSVGGVDGGLVLGGITDQPLGIGECDVRRRDAVALIVRDDLGGGIRRIS